MGVHQGKRHDGYIPIGVAILMTSCLISIFLVNAQANGYGSNDPLLVLESGGVIWAGTLVAWFVFIWRAQTLSYKYSWYPTNR